MLVVHEHTFGSCCSGGGCCTVDAADDVLDFLFDDFSTDRKMLSTICHLTLYYKVRTITTFFKATCQIPTFPCETFNKMISNRPQQNTKQIK